VSAEERTADASGPAFDPLGQAVYVQGVVTQGEHRAVVRCADPAGPTFPSSVSATHAQRHSRQALAVVLYLDNNSANAVVPAQLPLLPRRKLVEQTHVLVPAVGPGVRVGMVIHGPKTDLFVDRANCSVKSP